MSQLHLLTVVTMPIAFQILQSHFNHLTSFRSLIYLSLAICQLATFSQCVLHLFVISFDGITCLRIQCAWTKIIMQQFIKSHSFKWPWSVLLTRRLSKLFDITKVSPEQLHFVLSAFQMQRLQSLHILERPTACLDETLWTWLGHHA